MPWQRRPAVLALVIGVAVAGAVAAADSPPSPSPSLPAGVTPSQSADRPVALMLQADGPAAATAARAARAGGATQAQAGDSGRSQRQANARVQDRIVQQVRGRSLDVLFRVASAYNGVAVL